ncbi:MAG TPA: phosphoribosylaminoimidazolesuccinocarboxamide synthase [Candidatus Paceibacterota bacterium]
MIEGKTKIVRRDPEVLSEADREHKHVVTWKDKFSEPMDGKGNWSNTTNANICEILRHSGLPVAFLHTTGPNTDRTLYCDMIPLEVIVRGQIDPESSYLERNPRVPVGVPLDEPLVEFFLKTDGPEWKGKHLPDTDPFITRYKEDVGIWVHHSKKPVTRGGEIFISAELLGWNKDGMWPFEQLEVMARRSFGIVRDAFRLYDFNLKDWKEEYGFGPDGQLLHSDSYDNDIWRLEDKDGKEYSKQVIRIHGVEGIEDSKADYAYIAHLTGEMLRLVRQT